MRSDRERLMRWAQWLRRRPRQHGGRGLGLGGLLSVLGGLLGGCGGETVGPPPAQDMSQLYWALTLDQHALTIDTLPPYDTVRISATPRTIHGDPLPGLPAVTYGSTDSARVLVSADGLVRALKPGPGIRVVATLTAGAYTHADTVVLNVTAGGVPPTLVGFSIHPLAPDSARWEANALDGTVTAGGDTLVVRAADGAAQPIAGLAVDFRSSDTTIARIQPTVDPTTGQAVGVVTGRRPGLVTFVASATAYGVVKADTLSFTITAPLSADIGMRHPFVGASRWEFSPSDVTIEAGGIVGWFNSAAYGFKQNQLLDVVFADPTNVAEDQFFCVPVGEPYLGMTCGAGDIPAFGDTTSENFFGNYRTRQFPVPGTYAFHSALLNARGTIHVVRTPEASPPVGHSGVP